MGVLVSPFVPLVARRFKYTHTHTHTHTHIYIYIGNTAVHWCIGEGECLAVMKIVLNMAPALDTSHANKDGTGALHLAAMYNDERYTMLRHSP